MQGVFCAELWIEVDAGLRALLARPPMLGLELRFWLSAGDDLALFEDLEACRSCCETNCFEFWLAAECPFATFFLVLLS